MLKERGDSGGESCGCRDEGYDWRHHDGKADCFDGCSQGADGRLREVSALPRAGWRAGRAVRRLRMLFASEGRSHY